MANFSTFYTQRLIILVFYMISGHDIHAFSVFDSDDADGDDYYQEKINLPDFSIPSLTPVPLPLFNGINLFNFGRSSEFITSKSPSFRKLQISANKQDLENSSFVTFIKKLTCQQPKTLSNYETISKIIKTVSDSKKSIPTHSWIGIGTEVENTINLLKKSHGNKALEKSLYQISLKQAKDVERFLNNNPGTASIRCVIKKYNNHLSETLFTLEDNQQKALELFLENLSRYGEQVNLTFPCDSDHCLSFKSKSEAPFQQDKDTLSVIEDLRIFRGEDTSVSFCLSNYIKGYMPCSGSMAASELQMLAATFDNSLLKKRSSAIKFFVNNPTILESILKDFETIKNYESDFLHFCKVSKPKLKFYGQPEDFNFEQLFSKNPHFDYNTSMNEIMKRAESSDRAYDIAFGPKEKGNPVYKGIDKCYQLTLAYKALEEAASICRLGFKDGNSFSKVWNSVINLKNLFLTWSDDSEIKSRAINFLFNNNKWLTIAPYYQVGTSLFHPWSCFALDQMLLFEMIEKDSSFCSLLKSMLGQSKELKEYTSVIPFIKGLKKLSEGDTSGIVEISKSTIDATLSPFKKVGTLAINCLFKTSEMSSQILNVWANPFKGIKSKAYGFRRDLRDSPTQTIFDTAFGSGKSSFTGKERPAMSIVYIAEELFTILKKPKKFFSIQENIPVVKLVKSWTTDFANCRKVTTNSIKNFDEAKKIFVFTYNKLIGLTKFIKAMDSIAEKCCIHSELYNNLMLFENILDFSDNYRGIATESLFEKTIVNARLSFEKIGLDLQNLHDNDNDITGSQKYLLQEKIKHIDLYLKCLSDIKIHRGVNSLCKVLKSLKEDTFKKRASFDFDSTDLFKTGRVIKTCKEVFSVQDHFHVPYQGISEIGVYAGIAKMILFSQKSPNKFCFVDVNENGCEMMFNKLWNPLAFNPKVFKQNIVPSSFHIGSSSNVNYQHIFLTGRNKDGKSTFMRSVGYAYWLFMTFGIAAAEKATLSFIHFIYSLKKQTEDQSSGESSHSGQVTMLARMMKQILQESENSRKCLILCDELYNGTNCRDATAGICSFFEFLNTMIKNSMCILSSHHINPKNKHLLDDSCSGKLGYYYINRFHYLQPGMCNVLSESSTAEIMKEVAAMPSEIERFQDMLKKISI